MEKEKRTLERDEYLKVKEDASKDYNDAISDVNNQNQLDTKEKREIYANGMALKRFGNLNSEAVYIYIANFLIRDSEEFKSTFINMKKSLKEVARNYDVDPKIIIWRIADIEKYERLYGNSIEQEKNILDKPEGVMHIIEESNNENNNTIPNLMEENAQLISKNQELVIANRMLIEQVASLKARLISINNLSNFQNDLENVNQATIRK